MRTGDVTERTLVVGCGALGRELVALTADLPGIDIACLSPDLHNRPEGIPSCVRARIRQGRRMQAVALQRALAEAAA